jgi:hypothetical protein
MKHLSKNAIRLSIVLMLNIFFAVASHADEHQDVDNCLDQAMSYKQAIDAFADKYGKRSELEKTFSLNGSLNGFVFGLNGGSSVLGGTGGLLGGITNGVGASGGFTYGKITGNIEGSGDTVLEDAEVITINVIDVDKFDVAFQTISGAQANLQKTLEEVPDSELYSCRALSKVIGGPLQSVTNAAQALIRSADAFKVVNASDATMVQGFLNSASNFRLVMGKLETLQRKMESSQEGEFRTLSTWSQKSHIFMNTYYPKNFRLTEFFEWGIIFPKDQQLFSDYDNLKCTTDSVSGQVTTTISPAESIEVIVKAGTL